MLKLQQGQVYTMKLNSGEEMIAKVLFTGSDFITIENPVSIAPGPQGMGLVPSMFTAEQHIEVQLNTNSVSMCAKTEDNVCNKYIEATTGIKLPDKKIVLG